MQARVSKNGRIAIPASVGFRLGVRPGDVVDVSVDETDEAEKSGQAMRILLTAQKKNQCVAKVIEDPLTGLPLIDFGPDAPVLTNEMIAEMLADFP